MGSESTEKRITSELTTMIAIEMENVRNQVLKFVWERDSRWPEKWEKQWRKELWTEIPSTVSDFESEWFLWDDIHRATRKRGYTPVPVATLPRLVWDLAGMTIPS